MIDEHTFHNTSNSQMPRVPPDDLGMSTSTDHVISSGICPVLKIDFTVWHTCSHPMQSLGVASSFSACCSNVLRCSALRLVRPGALPFLNLRTAVAISWLSGISSLIENGMIWVSIGSSSVGLAQYNSLYSFCYFP